MLFWIFTELQLWRFQATAEQDPESHRSPQGAGRKKEADNTSKEIAAFEQQISRSLPVGVETQDEQWVSLKIWLF